LKSTPRRGSLYVSVAHLEAALVLSLEPFLVATAASIYLAALLAARTGTPPTMDGLASGAAFASPVLSFSFVGLAEIKEIRHIGSPKQGEGVCRPPCPMPLSPPVMTARLPPSAFSLGSLSPRHCRASASISLVVSGRCLQRGLLRHVDQRNPEFSVRDCLPAPSAVIPTPP